MFSNSMDMLIKKERKVKERKRTSLQNKKAQNEQLFMEINTEGTSLLRTEAGTKPLGKF